MTILQCVTAHRALQGLMEGKMDYPSAYALWKLNSRLEEQAGFYAREELALAREYGETGEDGALKLDGKGNFRLRDEEAAQEYRKKRGELDRLEVDWPYPQVELEAPGEITPAQVGALAPFVRWEEPV